MRRWHLTGKTPAWLVRAQAKNGQECLRLHVTSVSGGSLSRVDGLWGAVGIWGVFAWEFLGHGCGHGRGGERVCRWWMVSLKAGVDGRWHGGFRCVCAVVTWQCCRRQRPICTCRGDRGVWCLALQHSSMHARVEPASRLYRAIIVGATHGPNQLHLTKVSYAVCMSTWTVCTQPYIRIALHACYLI